MKYEIEFTEQTADQTYMGLWELFRLSEAHFKDGDLSRNLRVTTEFKCVVRHLKALGADTDVGTYNDNDFDRIGFAKINSHEFVKNGEFKFDVLRKALDELV